MPSIDDYRAKFPSLRDLPDEQLITRVAEVDNVSREDVMAHMGYNPSDAGRGLKESFQQLPQLGWGAVAGLGAAGEAAFGEGGIMSAVKNRGIKGYTEWSDKIESKSRESDSFNYSWEQAKEGDFGALIDWLQHGLGYVTGQGIQALATAGIGAIGGKMVLSEAAKTVAKGMVIKDATRIAEQQVAKEAADQGLALTGEQIAAQAAARAAAPETIKAATANVASKIGQTVGLGGMAIGQEGGEIFGDLTSRAQEEGRQLTGDDLAKAFGATLMAGGLEFVGDKLGLDIVMGKTGLTKMAGGIQGVGGKVARGAIAGAAAIPAEAGTEYFQTGLEEYGKGTEQNMLPFNQSETAQAGAFDAAMLGGLGGGAIGAAGGLMSKARAKAVDQQASNTLSTTNDVGQMVAAAETLAMAPLEWNGRYEPEGGFQSKDPLYVFPDGSAATRDETVNVLAANAAQDNLEQWFARSPAPMERDKAETLAEMAGEKTGKPMSTVPLPDGSGWTVVPTAWVDSPAVAGYIEQATAANAIEQEKRARIEIAASAPVDRAPRTVQQENTGPAKDMTDADLVKATVDQFRRTNTPQARAFVGQYDAGRITNDDVLGLLGRPPKSPDQRIAEAAAQAPTIQPGDLLTADGFPYGSKSAATVRAIKEGGKVIEVPGGYAVRKESQGGPGQADDDRQMGPRTRDAEKPTQEQIGRGLDDGDGGNNAKTPLGLTAALTDIPTLKKQWGEATAAGDTARAKDINDRIVALKAASGVTWVSGVTSTSGVKPASVEQPAGTLKERVEAKKAEPQESDQDKSNRQWRENYQATVATEDLATLSAGQIEQAINYAAKQASNLGPKAWAGDEEAKKLITAFQREEELMKFHLKTREKPAIKPQSDTKPAAPVTPQDQAGTPAEGAGASRPTPAAPNTTPMAEKGAADKPGPAKPEAASATVREMGAKHFAQGKPRTPPGGLTDSDKLEWMQGWDKASQSNAKPEAAPKPKRPPKSFRAKQMVTTTVLVEETGKFEKREIDAETAMVALDADINELEAFLKCLQKG